MKKKSIVFLFISFFIINTLYSQEISVKNTEISTVIPSEEIVLDTCIISIQYQMSCINDVKNPEKVKTNTMVLQIGRRISKFTDFMFLKVNSLIKQYAEQKRNSVEAMTKLLPLAKGTTQLNIYKNYPKNKITTTDLIPFEGTFMYVENKEKPLWRIGDGSITVCGYECKKATTTFRGRNYTAWYAPKIAISDGPWKFWGLPGLILKVTDDKKEYDFECIAVNKSIELNQIFITKKDYINTTKAKFNDALKKLNENPGAAIQASGRIKGGLQDKMKSRPYNPIELSQ